jgi:phosphate transport system substrate-binding protein
MKTKKILGLGLAMALAVGGLAACSPAQDTASPSPGTTEAAAQSGTIKVSGSTSVFPVLDGLKDMFMDKYPDIKVQVEQGGSGVGISNVTDGVVDIGMSSRNLKDEEKGLSETTLCLDGIAVVVNNDNAVKDLTAEQIAKIYKGEIKNWKEVGGKDAKITLITRESTSGTRGAFEELVLDGEVIDDTLCLVQNSTGNAAASVESDPNAIGYISLGVLGNYSKLHAVKVDGVEATEENVLNDSYTLSRPFLLLTKEAPAGIVKTFLDYVTTDQEALGFIEEEHYILVK